MAVVTQWYRRGSKAAGYLDFGVPAAVITTAEITLVSTVVAAILLSFTFVTRPIIDQNPPRVSPSPSGTATPRPTGTPGTPTGGVPAPIDIPKTVIIRGRYAPPLATNLIPGFPNIPSLPGMSDSIDVIGSTSSVRLGNATTLAPLTPGGFIPLNITFQNLGTSAVTITHIAVTLNGVSAPNATATQPCAVADFYLNQMSNSVTLPLGSLMAGNLDSSGISSSSWPSLGMLDTSLDQDGCKNATVLLSYSARGSNT